MPNWCSNDLEIRGTKEDLEAIKKQVSKSYIHKGYTLKFDPELQEWKRTYHEEDTGELVFSFQNIVPMNMDLMKEDNENWYEWRLKNWDTKWDSCEVLLSERDNSLMYSFDTAWSPPMNVYVELSKQYPRTTLIVNYYEGGMSFYGMHIIRNGEELSSISGDMSHLAEIMLGNECYCESLDMSEAEEAPYSDCPVIKITTKEEVNNG
jgi:hypothetical protein